MIVYLLFLPPCMVTVPLSGQVKLDNKTVIQITGFRFQCLQAL